MSECMRNSHSCVNSFGWVVTLFISISMASKKFMHERKYKECSPTSAAIYFPWNIWTVHSLNWADYNILRTFNFVSIGRGDTLKWFNSNEKTTRVSFSTRKKKTYIESSPPAEFHINIRKLLPKHISHLNIV